MPFLFLFLFLFFFAELCQSVMTSSTVVTAIIWTRELDFLLLQRQMSHQLGEARVVVSMLLNKNYT